MRIEGVRALSDALKTNTTLTTLDKSCMKSRQGFAKSGQNINNNAQSTRLEQKEQEH